MVLSAASGFAYGEGGGHSSLGASEAGFCSWQPLLFLSKHSAHILLPASHALMVALYNIAVWGKSPKSVGILRSISTDSAFPGWMKQYL